MIQLERYLDPIGRFKRHGGLLGPLVTHYRLRIFHFSSVLNLATSFLYLFRTLNHEIGVLPQWGGP